MFEGYLAILNEVWWNAISLIWGVYIILRVWRLSHGTDFSLFFFYSLLLQSLMFTMNL